MRLHRALLAIALLAPCGLHAQSAALHRLRDGEPTRIVCFGDSITGLYYHTGGHRDWCDLVGLGLRQVFPKASVEIINAGVSGNSTADALRRMDADVLAAQPQLVLVMFGMNDVALLPPAEFHANLVTITRRAQAAGAEVVLLTTTPSFPGDAHRPPARVAEYAEIVRATGRDLGVTVVDTHAAFMSACAADPMARLRLMSDSIHPNLRGHRLIAETVVNRLTGQRVSLAHLPPLVPALPRVQAQLRAGATLRVVAMKPFDSLIGPALRRVRPEARIEVVPWDVAGKSLATLMAEAEARGWPSFHQPTDRPRPDLCILAIPTGATAPDLDHYYHDYTWVMNWSQSFKQPGWDCVMMMPSVANPAQTEAEMPALDVIQGNDLPYLRRAPGDQRDPETFLKDWLQALLADTPRN
ncbi:MAG: SGNH/GDSL hydrolase family protein [Verrucomicrobia bacterium]|nr:SGNH/GDSL hydrolase family protein [Verrucomicrobiota bacterium]